LDARAFFRAYDCVQIFAAGPQKSDRAETRVRGAMRGEGWFSAKITAHMAEWMSGDKSKKTELTEREVAVLRLVTQGKTNKEIGKALGD